MKIGTDKLELHIILVALILALSIIGVFWALNRGETPTYTSNPSSSADRIDMPDTVTADDSEAATTDLMLGEQSTLTHQGLTKLLEPTTVKALVFGDAVAESLGASSQELFSWHTLVAKDLQNKYPGTLQWQLETTSGATINDALTYAPEVAQDIDLVILCLGRNDSTKIRQTLFKKTYDELLVELKTKLPQVDIVLVVEPPVKDVTENNRFFPYRKIIMDLGQKHTLPVIDGWTAFIDDPSPLDELLADGVNPNDQGYRVLADEVVKGFEETLASVETKRAATESSGL